MFQVSEKKQELLTDYTAYLEASMLVDASILGQKDLICRLNNEKNKIIAILSKSKNPKLGLINCFIKAFGLKITLSCLKKYYFTINRF